MWRVTLTLGARSAGRGSEVTSKLCKPVWKEDPFQAATHRGGGRRGVQGAAGAPVTVPGDRGLRPGLGLGLWMGRMRETVLRPSLGPSPSPAMIWAWRTGSCTLWVISLPGVQTLRTAREKERGDPDAGAGQKDP